MPKVTIWIRNEDEAKWKAIENKPEWLHLIISNLGDDPTTKFAASLLRENKKLDHLIKHPEESKLDGLSAIINDNSSTYDSLNREPKLTPPEETA